MLDVTIGIVMLLFFCWNGFQAVSVDMFEYTTRWYLQMLISGLGGLGLIFPVVYKKLQPSKTTAVVKESNCSTVDYEHLVHLREVMISRGNVDGARLVSQINTILFEEPIKNATLSTGGPINEK